MKYLNVVEFEKLVRELIYQSSLLNYDCKFRNFSIDGEQKYLEITCADDMISCAIFRMIPDSLQYCVSSDGERPTLNIWPSTLDR